ATDEMWTQWRQHLCIYDSKLEDTVVKLSFLLPTLMPLEDHPKYGSGLWLPELMQLWMSFPNHSFEKNLLYMFTSLAMNTVGYVNDHCLVYSKREYHHQISLNCLFSLDSQIGIHTCPP